MITKLGYKSLLNNVALAETVESVITQIGVGNGTTIVTEGDVDLSGSVTERFPVLSVNPLNNKATFRGILPYNKFNGQTISEVGLYTKDGKLFARRVLPEGERVSKSLSIQVEINWEIIAY